MTRWRIAFAGFQHETNTFAPGSAGMAEFEMADSWPGLLRGSEVVTETRGLNLPVAGAIAAAEQSGRVEIVPVLWCAAEPSGPVTDDAFDRICAMILKGLREAGPLDAVCLDLHGAMVTDSHEDGEGELLRRLRAALGPALPIGVSLDLHANISPQMVRRASLITVYRTYPHLDMAPTGARCLAALLRHLEGAPLRAAFRQAPFLVPLHAQATTMEPCRSLYAGLETLPEDPGEWVELAMGFTASDIRDCGPSVVAHAVNDERAAQLADSMLDRLCAAEGAFDTALLEPEEAVRRALASPPGAGPVVIADVQDNPGAGGTSDTTGLLRALVDLGARNALVGVICDPAMALRAHRLGAGAEFEGGIGGRSGLPGEAPLWGRFRVLALSEGRIAYSGEMYGGGVAEIGPSCLLALARGAAEIRVVVSSLRTQCLDRAFFTHFGADPAAARIVCVKSTAHFRADFEPIASAVLNAAAPGAFPCRLSTVPYRRLRTGVRRAGTSPAGPALPRPR